MEAESPLPRAHPTYTVAVAGSETPYPVGRVFCVGRNYAAHAREMGAAAKPIFFMKPASAVIAPADAAFPPHTEQLDHEIELVVAVGAEGAPTTPDDARALICGYAVGVDLTRRDVQSQLKAKSAPWEVAKAFDGSAPVGPIRSVADIGHPRAGRIWFSVGDETRQDGDLSEMLLSPEDLLITLARTWRLQPGDLVFTGTPAGVGPIGRGQVGRGGVEGVGEIEIRPV